MKVFELPSGTDPQQLAIALRGLADAVEELQFCESNNEQLQIIIYEGEDAPDPIGDVAYVEGIEISHLFDRSIIIDEVNLEL